MPQRLDILRRHHCRLLEIMSTGQALLTNLADDADLDALRHLRGEMNEALAAYQRFVHDAVFNATMQEQGFLARADARALKIDCIQLQADYEEFCRRWERRRVLDHWSEYRLSTVRFMQQVRDQISHVEELRKAWALAGLMQ
jgi:hypothetical protein